MPVEKCTDWEQKEQSSAHPPERALMTEQRSIVLPAKVWRILSVHDSRWSRPWSSRLRIDNASSRVILSPEKAFNPMISNLFRIDLMNLVIRLLRAKYPIEKLPDSAWPCPPYRALKLQNIKLKANKLRRYGITYDFWLSTWSYLAKLTIYLESGEEGWGNDLTWRKKLR